MKTKSLMPHVLDIVRDKNTEHPFSGEYDQADEPGTYLCRQCGLALFRAETKFPSGCGWPSFDQDIEGAVAKEPDADGQRIEILCSRCDAHLGHVFTGEGHTAKDTRHCVNSLSLDFVTDTQVTDTQEAIIAGGCFWGVQTLFNTLNGVLKTEVGYCGGEKEYPTYEEVCASHTGHLEALRIVFNPDVVTYETVIQHFFNIHDPTQGNGQGPDLGSQYLSAVFYYDETQKLVTEKIINVLKQKKFDVQTALLPVTTFWPAEEYHQDYYGKTGKAPYCHAFVKRI